MDWQQERTQATDDLEEAEEQQPELFYPSVDQFVAGYLIQTYRRKIPVAGRGIGLTWCAQWWRHPEAVSRLTALWRAWEYLRLEPTTGMAVWWRDYADPTMRALFDPNGSFEGCTPEEHQPKVVPLPVIAPPNGLFE